MLVLSRLKGESILLPTLGIQVMVVDIRGDKIRLGFSAPPEIPIYREEVWAHILREEQAKQKKEQGDDDDQC
jgi:carbon storage regulator